MADPSEFKKLRLYDIEQYIVKTVARLQFEGNESQAIRHMIRTYGQERLLGKPDSDNGQPIQINAVPTLTS